MNSSSTDLCDLLHEPSYIKLSSLLWIIRCWLFHQRQRQRYVFQLYVNGHAVGGCVKRQQAVPEVSYSGYILHAAKEDGNQLTF